MNLKAAAQLSVSAIILGTLLLPMQKEEFIPVPNLKPALIDGVEVPAPPTKPGYKPTIVEKLVFSIQGTYTTMFAPRLSTKAETQYPNGFKPLTAQQSALYAQIFDAQREGHWKRADLLISKIRDDRLLGHVYAQRYLNSSYKTRFKEAKAWLAKYNDYPQANDIHNLAVSLNKGSASSLVQPTATPRVVRAREPMIAYAKTYVSSQGRDNATRQSVKMLKRQVNSLIRRGYVTKALVLFESDARRALLDQVEIDQVQADIASGYLYAKDFKAAKALAAESATRSGEYVPKAAWVAGLAAWQTNEYTKAAVHFTQVAQSTYASGWKRAAGAYWAARSYQALNNQTEYRASLEVAARHSRTFYGLLARTSLGERSGDFNWDTPTYSRDDEALLLSQKAGQRVYSLVSAGQYDLAESELLRLNYKTTPDLKKAALGYATRFGLPGVALRLGNMTSGHDGRYYDSAAYPLVAWQPEDGYRIDPALIHAVMRQESRFDLNAKSYSGALGLMQVMPTTAHYIAQKNGYDLTDAQMRMPERNIKIGQDYIEYLLKMRSVGRDVVSMLIAYNAGPGNLEKWSKRIDTQDTLLLIEMLPVKETRDYVEHVLSNYWIYRMRAGQDVPTMNALLSGQSPKYAQRSIETSQYELASSY